MKATLLLSAVISGAISLIVCVTFITVFGRKMLLKSGKLIKELNFELTTTAMEAVRNAVSRH